MTGLAIVVTIVVSVSTGISSNIALAVLAVAFGGLLVWRLGLDRAFIWALLIPWQFLPFIKANILLNPWIWIALLRLLSKTKPHDSRPPAWTIVMLVFLAPSAYLGSSLLFGIDETSLLMWVIPAVIVGFSFLLRPPDSTLMRRQIVLVGGVYTLLTIVEFITDISFNNLLADVPGVSDYLRSSRSLGPAGNPLFSSAVLLVVFFAIPRSMRFANTMRALVILAIVMTGSKSALIGLAVALPVAVFSLGIRRSFGLIASSALGAVLILTTLPTAATALLDRFSVFENLQESDPDRAFTTDFVLGSILENPLGGIPIGSVLVEKQLRSPVENGDRFGIESTWLALMSDVGVFVFILIAVSVAYRLIENFKQWESVGILALFVSLFFWNGWYGAWVIIPLWSCLVFSNSASENSSAVPGPYPVGRTALPIGSR
ncbi:hypothetical protein J2X01_002471 [Arthrobacter ginsengisoli]|uniref:O-antigen ligase-related domain-containing protein n=1 Tax=Arthrobacter ginsengisoli TaxID=1356565 RepID=A0ABU1UD94_9MICC|nr:O-antigen ligase family protein [Arthrobacter ginsengisoli]MDR7083178.1 hypothetical protein [Arthrobacter ginsengisoli]